MPEEKNQNLLGMAAIGLPFVGSVANAFMQGAMNKRSRRWSEKMYDWQRRDALTDWALQNEYNHPSSQMARLREAGLNPNLVYGDGGATMQSAQVKGADAPGWNPRPPQVDGLGSGLMSYFDAQIKQAQIDNLRVQNTVLLEESMLKRAQTSATLTGAAKTEFDLGLMRDLRETTIEGARAGVQKTYADIKSTLDENERRAAMQAPNLQIAAETVLNMRMQRTKSQAEIDEIRYKIASIKKDLTLKQLDIDLKKLGIQPSDALWQRVLARVLGGDISGKLNLSEITKPTTKPIIKAWEDPVERAREWILKRKKK